MPQINRTAQQAIMPFAALMTVVLGGGTWMEILTHGHWKLQDDLSKFYLAIMTAYAGAAEISKWVVDAPTDPQEDPMFERIHRGGFFIWFWLVPLLTALIWRVVDTTVPMPKSLPTITGGLVGIFFLKMASRHMRHKKHGILGEDSVTDDSPSSPRFDDELYLKIKSVPNGLAVVEITAAFPDASAPTLYRAFDRLVKAKRIIRTGKPRTQDVRYKAVGK